MAKVCVYPNKQARNISNIEQKVRSYLAAWNKDKDKDDLKLDLFFKVLYPIMTFTEFKKERMLTGEN